MTIKEKYIRLIGIPLLALAIPFVTSATDYWQSTLISFMYTLIYWQGGWMIVQWMRRRYPRYEQTPKRLASQALIVFIFITVTTPLCMLLFREEHSIAEFAKGWLISMVASFVVVSIYESAYFFHKWRETKLETEKLKREHIQSQFETLKNQVNPHFLFNSLNTLTAIILENPNLAVEFVEKLSNVYRYVLQSKDRELVDLATELKFAKAFLFLHQIRFGDNLQFRVNISEKDLESSIAPLSLQILLENVVKHNIISQSKPLMVDIYIEKNYIIVKNNLQKKTIQESSTKIGLQNIINRYKYLTDKTVNVITTTKNFMVALPLLKIENAYA